MLIVYKIQHNESDNFYIGSTKNLNKRIKRHKANIKAKDKCHFKLYQFISENGGWENFNCSILASLDDIDLIDVSKKEVLEQRYIEKYCPTLNDRNAYQSDEQKKENQKIYNKNYGNHLYECECGKSIKWKNKSKHLKTQRHVDFIEQKPIIMTFD